MTTHEPDEQQGAPRPNPFAPPSGRPVGPPPPAPVPGGWPGGPGAAAPGPSAPAPGPYPPRPYAPAAGTGPWAPPPPPSGTAGPYAPTAAPPVRTAEPDATTAPVRTLGYPGGPSAPVTEAPAPVTSGSPALGPTTADAGTAPSNPWAPAPPWGTGAGLPGDRPHGGSTGHPARRRRVLSVAWLVPLLLLSLLAGAVGGLLAGRTAGDDRLADAGLPVSVGPDEETRPAAGVAGIADAVLPSVVSIEVSSAQGQATGSGFVLRQDGYLLTNNHVIAGGVEPGSEIRVLFSDGSEEPATVVGRTSEYDIAVLKVERTGLDPLLLADSDRVVVGDSVVAIGAPLGLEGTVTTGIVSALNRPVEAGGSGETAFINAIQTDAAINPGNSGGPLVNAEGEVVGINSAIAQPPGGQGASGSIGLGFAIPSNQARRTAEELIETGAATYPIIGVLLDERYTGEGVQVATEPSGTTPPVSEGGPAANAGIRPGDVIVAIDGRPVTEPDELIVSIRAKAPGDATVLTVRSGDDERDVRVVLDQATSD